MTLFTYTKYVALFDGMCGSFGQDSKHMPGSPLSVNLLANSGDEKLKGILYRVVMRLKDTRTSIREYFAVPQ